MAAFLYFGELPVYRRYPGEVHDLKEFVQPNSAAVRQLYSSIIFPEMSDGEKAYACADWVTNNIKYPASDIHELRAFDGYYAKVLDYWDFPSEVLAAKQSDCDGSAILLASLIRNFASPNDVYVALGGLDSAEMNHAWVDYKGYILEPTSPRLGIPVKKQDRYKTMVFFNDTQIFATSKAAIDLSEQELVPVSNTPLLDDLEEQLRQVTVPLGQILDLEFDMAGKVSSSTLDEIRHKLEKQGVSIKKVFQDQKNTVHMVFSPESKAGIGIFWLWPILAATALIPTGVFAWRLYTVKPEEAFIPQLLPFVAITVGIIVFGAVGYLLLSKAL